VADPYTFLGSLGVLMKRKIMGEIVAMRGVKFQLALKIRFRKERNDGGKS
jgi:ClpP class serine protease